MKNQLREKAIKMRTQGCSIKEVSDLLSVSKSTVSVWVRNVRLNEIAIQRLKNRSEEGREKGVKVRQEKRKKNYKEIENRVLSYLNNIKRNIELDKLCCALLFWCEGEKTLSSVRFINSDPKMMEFFLGVFRSSFQLDESRFRICLHLHNYHDQKEEIKFWSNLSGIPESQFLKVYNKPNTGKNKKYDYHGCVSLRYNDSQIAKELYLIYTNFTKNHGRVV